MFPIVIRPTSVRRCPSNVLQRRLADACGGFISPSAPPSRRTPAGKDYSVGDLLRETGHDGGSDAAARVDVGDRANGTPEPAPIAGAPVGQSGGVPSTRRAWLRGALAAAAASSAWAARPAAANGPGDPADVPRFRFCLNMSTIRGQNLSVTEEIEIAAQAGYQAIEPWLGKLHAFVESGGKPAELRKRIADHGLTVESAIGFATWIVDDLEQRRRGFEQARRDMDLIAQLGGKRIAAPPAGVPRGQRVELDRAAERYGRLIEIGREYGVVPQIEMWGGNPSIGRLGQAIYVAVECGRPEACFLGDVFHIYRSGSDFAGLRLLGPQALQVFHFNDYPADPPRERIRDEHRVFPGDGVAPIAQILRTFRDVGATPVLSLELFNRSYWERPALDVAREGLRKMKAAVRAAFASDADRRTTSD
ncbi:MAG: sugar phosphate isomerase/epimerase [Planctomycetota bacterium]|nr:MAG: sugar phosphate isomerase/epimerase [Planctomycetota bacterium]